MLKTTLSIILLSVFSFCCVAQKYSTSNKKAIKSYQKALTAYQNYDFTTAEEAMLKAIKSDNNFIEAHIVLSEIYIDKKEFANAIESYRNVIRINPDFFPQLYFSLAELEMMVNDFLMAKQHLQKFLSYKSIKPDIRIAAKKKLRSCKFAMNAIQNPVPFNPENLGDSINTQYDEYWPSLTADEQTLLMTRLMPRNPANTNKNLKKNSRNYQEDFYIAVKENGFWKKAIDAGKTLNTRYNEGAQTISVDGKQMYYTACQRSKGKGSCDIYVSVLQPQGWSKSENIGSPVNTSSWEGQPSISPDGQTLYFVSNRSGGSGGKDIWYSNLRSDGTWSKPVNLGKSINTSADEQSPFIHSDNKTLYFASAGKTGMGGFDLFKSTRNNEGDWDEAVNLGYPINTTSNEVGLIVNAQGDKALFASDRNKNQGKDIYQFELYKEARPNPVSYLKGITFDKETKQKLQAKFELINLETNKLVMQSISDEYTGEFLICIPTNNDYALNVTAPGYLFYSDNFTLKGIYNISKPYLKNIALNPIKVGERLVLRNIFFETDSYILDKKSLVELTKLTKFLERNPSLVVEISGHTDNVGTSKYNQSLSQNRAKSVYQYLIDNEINSNRLKYKGYGETQAISSNNTEKGRAENRRTEIKILAK